jgi:hypothetical protein
MHCQAKKCDPEGDYVRQWCPELANLPVEYIHCPWEAKPSMLAAAGVSLRRVKWSSPSGRHPVLPSRGSYPQRCITDLVQARLVSLRAVLEVRRGPGKPHVCADDGHERIRLSNGRTVKLITRIDFREEAEKPLTEQRAASKWDTTKRERADFLSSTMRAMEGRNIIV